MQPIVLPVFRLHPSKRSSNGDTLLQQIREIERVFEGLPLGEPPICVHARYPMSVTDIVCGGTGTLAHVHSAICLRARYVISGMDMCTILPGKRALRGRSMDRGAGSSPMRCLVLMSCDVRSDIACHYAMSGSETGTGRKVFSGSCVGPTLCEWDPGSLCVFYAMSKTALAFSRIVLIPVVVNLPSIRCAMSNTASRSHAVAVRCLVLRSGIR
eukprot:2183327-Rhodomonas_salina.5